VCQVSIHCCYDSFARELPDAQLCISKSVLAILRHLRPHSACPFPQLLHTVVQGRQEAESGEERRSGQEEQLKTKFTKEQQKQIYIESNFRANSCKSDTIFFLLLIFKFN
jgi:hypothetical protein